MVLQPLRLQPRRHRRRPASHLFHHLQEMHGGQLNVHREIRELLLLLLFELEVESMRQVLAQQEQLPDRALHQSLLHLLPNLRGLQACQYLRLRLQVVRDALEIV
jgi:hypothetical protein